MAQQKKISAMTKLCAWVFTFLWGGLFLVLALFLIPTGVLMKKSNYIQRPGTATGDCDIEKRKNSTTIKCGVRYTLNGSTLTNTIITPREYTEGERVELYVDTSRPSLALLDDPKKSSTLYIVIGIVALVIFFASMHGAWKHPSFFCFWGSTRAFIPR